LPFESDRPVEPTPYSLLTASRWTVVLSIAIATADNFADPDLWMHILTGQTILRARQIPRFDTYSYSASGMPWHNHEWLAQVAFAFFYARLDVIGLKLLKVLCATVTIVALAIGISATSAAGRVQRLTLILSAVALANQMQFRPQLFTFMLLSVVVASIGIEVYRGGATLWPLIPMFALWANLHGGYTIGLGAMIIAAAVLFIQGVGDPARKVSARRLAMVTLGCAAATIINPFGVGLWTGVAHSVSDPLIRQIVNDWVPLPQTLLEQWRESGPALLRDATPLLLFAGFAAVVAMAPDRKDAALVAIAAIFIGAAFYAARNVALAVIALAIPLARHASLALEPASTTKIGMRPGTRDEPTLALLAIGALAVGIVGGTFSNRLKTWKPMPAAAVAFMERRGLRGDILNRFEWGEYLVWHLGDNSRVFIDGRSELVYPDELIRKYAVFFYGIEGADKLLDAYPHDYVLMGVHDKGADVVRRDPRWHLLYSDQTAALFGRNALPGQQPVGGNVAGINGNAADTYFP
jgi:hypothetical protein